MRKDWAQAIHHRTSLDIRGDLGPFDQKAMLDFNKLLLMHNKTPLWKKKAKKP